jgi:hypothetical protein
MPPTISIVLWKHELRGPDSGTVREKSPYPMGYEPGATDWTGTHGTGNSDGECYDLRP